MSGKFVRLELENFQAHAKFVADFEPGVNLIVGANDIGKSTLVRAIRWVAFNRPAGNTVVRWGKKKCRVRLTTDAADVLRGKEGGNYYELDGKRRDAVGTSVPQDVQDALRLDSINFQRQIDGPFWFSLTPGDVAEEMNRIVNLSIIDRSMDSAASLAKQSTSEVKVLDELLSSAKLKAGKLRWVPEAMTRLQDAISRSQDADTARSEYERLSRLIEQVEEATEGIPESPDLSPLYPTIARMVTIKDSLPTLTKLITFLEDEEADSCQLNAAIEKNKAEVERLKPELCPACKQPLTSDRSS